MSPKFTYDAKPKPVVLKGQALVDMRRASVNPFAVPANWSPGEGPYDDDLGLVGNKDKGSF